MSRPAWLAVDVGQSGVRYRFEGAQVAGTLPAGHRSGDAARVTIRHVLDAIATRQGQGLSPHRLAIGLTGCFGVAPDAAEALDELPGGWAVAELVLADDSVTAFLGALEGRPGVVVAAGTGVVGLAVGHDGMPHRVGGNGPFVGDLGAGCWIGREGLGSVMAVQDGMGPGTLLLDLARDEFGAIDAIPSVVTAAGNPVGLVSSFSRSVARAADQGDAVAGRIMRDAGRHLGELAVAAARRLPPAGTGPLLHCLTGNVRKAGDPLLRGYDEAVSLAFPVNRSIAPTHDPLHGAALLARGETTLAAGRLVSVARTSREVR